MKNIKLQTEQQQIEHDAAQQNKTEEYQSLKNQHSTPLTAKDYANIRRQLNLPKYIPLENLIAFTQTAVISQTLYSQEQLAEFCGYFSFNDEMIELINNKFHPEIDESLTDVIYKQNPARNRSITELFCNAKDAKATRIEVIIKDGYYEIKDNGIGMDAYTILFYLLKNNSTTKTGSAETIGQFGIGFFTALPHLIDKDDEIIINTRRENCPGYRISIRKIAGKFCCNIVEEPALQEIGTCIQIKSKEIKQDEYTKALKNYIAYSAIDNVTINNEVFLSELPKKVIKVSNSLLAYTCTQAESIMVITSGGIKIQQENKFSYNQNLLIVWELPKQCTLTETRSNIIIDSDFIRDEIKALINHVDDMVEELQIPYLNAIAPMIHKLQKNNTSLKTEDNLLFYAQNKAQSIIGLREQIPDVKKFIPLANSRILLNQLLIPAGWQKLIGHYAPEWYSEEYQVYLVDFNKTQTINTNNGFICERKNKVIYLDKKYYANYNEDHWKLDSLFNLPPGVIQGKWQKFSEQQREGNTFFKMFSSKLAYLGIAPYQLDYYSQNGFNYYLAKDSKGGEFVLDENFCAILDKETQISAKATITQCDIVAIPDLTRDSEPPYSVYSKDGERLYFYMSSTIPPVIEKLNENYYIIYQNTSDNIYKNKKHQGHLYNIKDKKYKFYNHIQKVSNNPLLISYFSDEKYSDDGCYKIKNLSDPGQKEFNGLPIKNSDFYINWSANDNNRGSKVLENEYTTIADFSIINDQGNILYSNNKINFDGINNLTCRLIEEYLYICIWKNYNGVTLLVYDTQQKKLITQTSLEAKGKTACFKEISVKNDENMMLIVDKEKGILPLPKIASVLQYSTNLTYIKTKSYTLFLVNKEQLVNMDNQEVMELEYTVEDIKFSELDDFLIMQFKLPNNELQTGLMDYSTQTVWADSSYKSIWRISSCVYEITRHDRSTTLIINGNKNLNACAGLHGSYPVIFSSNNPYDRNNTDTPHHVVIYDIHNKPVIANMLFDVNRIRRPADKIYYQFPNWRDLYYRNQRNCCFIEVLDETQLQSPVIQTNLEWLRQHHLTLLEQSKCLRFIHFDLGVFTSLYPYMQILNYVPTVVQLTDYLDLIKKVESLPKTQRILALQALDIIYELCGVYTKATFADKIYTIINNYGTQLLDKLCLALKQDFTKFKISFKPIDKNLINSLPIEVWGIAFYIFCPANALLNNHYFPLWKNHPNTNTGKISLLQLMAAYRLDASIFNEEDLEIITHKINKSTLNVNLAELQRALIHAIYHQGRGNKLYIREFLQNAVDAIKQSEFSEGSIDIQLAQISNSYVFSIADSGIGMSGHNVFKYLLVVGNSTKRQSVNLIGGRGVGFFTAFDGAQHITIKTGTGDTWTYFFKITPIYEKDTQGRAIIIDATIEWYREKTFFKGFIVERTALEESSSLEPALLYKEAMRHGACLSTEKVNIFINNYSLPFRAVPLVDIDIENFGKIAIYKGAENVITAGGLYVNAIFDELLNKLPSMIKEKLLENHIIIALPATIPLVRARDDFEDRENFIKSLVDPLTILLVRAFLELILKGFIKMEHLPYDYFDVRNDNSCHLSVIEEREATVLKILQEKNLSVWGNSLDKETLTVLLCYVKCIPYENKKISLAHFAYLYKTQPYITEINKDLLKYVSYAIGEQLKNINDSSASQRFFNQIIKEHKLVPTVWTINSNKQTVSDESVNNNNNFGHWSLFAELSQRILETFNSSYPTPLSNSISIAFSTKEGSAKAYVYKGETCVYWNPIHTEKLVKQIGQALATESFEAFESALQEMVKTLSHEYTHLHEAPCSGTHNITFYKGQRNIYLYSFKDLSARKLFNEFTEYYERHVYDQPFMSAVEFVKAYSEVSTESSNITLSL